jgi:hypothetical protein
MDTDRMERMALNLNASAGSLCVALVSIALAPAVHAQISSSSFDAIGSSDAPSTPGVRSPPFVYGVDAGVGETDNVTLVSTNKVSQTLAVADVDFAANEQTRLLDLRAAGDFSDLNYLQGAYGNQLIGRFDGVGKVAIVPGRLTWTVRDDFGQAAVDAYTPQIPTNLEDINYFSTGPDLTLPLDGIDFINVAARYKRTQYQTTPFDSNRFSGNVGFGRNMSAGSAISLDGSFERILFDNTALNTDYDRTSPYARYELHGARTDLTADLGVTRVTEAGSSNTGGLVTVELSRKLSASAKLTFTAGRQLTDAGATFSAAQPGASGTVTSAQAAQTTENYTTTYVSAGWQYVRYRTRFAVSARYEKDSYPGEYTLDHTRPGAEFRLERRLTRAFSAQLLGSWYKTDYPHATLASEVAGSNQTGLAGATVTSPPGVVSPLSSPNYGDGLLGASLAWRHGRGLEIRMRYEHTSHNVSTGAGGFQENRVILTVGYRPVASAAELPETE